MNKKVILASIVVGALLLVGAGAMAMDEETTTETDMLIEQQDQFMSESGPLMMLMMNDLDSDGIANCEDVDDDDDGLNDTVDQYPHDHDNDGIPDISDADDDNDGILDSEDDYYVGNTTAIEEMQEDLRERVGNRGNGNGYRRGNAQNIQSRTMDHLKQFANNDLDSDGIANCEDVDDDGDGLNDTEDTGPFDHDNDGIPDFRDLDDDNDGIPDDQDDDYVGNTPELVNFGKRGSVDGSDDGILQKMYRWMKGK